MANKPKRIDLSWSPEFAYVIGIITADGNLSPSGRHICITSKDKEIVLNCKHALGIDNKIGKKARGYSHEKRYFVLQFGSVAFYRLLENIGLTPNKSKTIGALHIPRYYFADFLRGYFDGDGNINTFSHPESRHAQLRIRLASGSYKFLDWLHEELRKHYKVQGGWVYSDRRKDVHSLTFGKEDSMKLLRTMYNDPTRPKLTRKFKVAEQFLGEW